MTTGAIAILPEVGQALATGRAVVALESTIISHGMPFPQNVEMAADVERIVREGGAVPATIAVLDGVCHVGLAGDQLHQLATAQGVHKATTRDLPPHWPTGAAPPPAISSPGSPWRRLRYPSDFGA